MPATQTPTPGTGFSGVDASEDDEARTIGSSVGDLAPEFVAVTNWINSEPLTMAELRGQVVLVDF